MIRLLFDECVDRRIVSGLFGIGTAIADLKLMIEAATMDELDQTIVFIPL